MSFRHIHNFTMACQISGKPASVSSAADVELTSGSVRGT